MDDNWGNILYLILMALFVIVGALKKKKKPVENFESATAERAEDDVPVDMENIFDTLLGANSFTPQQEHPYQQVEEAIVEEREEISPKYEAKVESQPESVESKIPTIQELQDLSYDEEFTEEIDEFDWRQAIISKEILDRKYI